MDRAAYVYKPKLMSESVLEKKLNMIRDRVMKVDASVAIAHLDDCIEELGSRADDDKNIYRNETGDSFVDAHGVPVALNDNLSNKPSNRISLEKMEQELLNTHENNEK